MPEREHTSKQYEQQLRTLKEKLLLMSHKAEVSIADATQALVERRPSLAQRVVEGEQVRGPQQLSARLKQMKIRPEFIAQPLE